MRVLIVEDEVIIAETLQVMLSQLGYSEVQKCRNQDCAEKILSNQLVDLAILDINLAGQHEGLELAKICHENSIPFFFLTSYSDKKTVLEAKELKPGSYVIKPFSPQEIMVAIELTLIHQQPKLNQKLKKAVQVSDLSNREAEILEYIAQRLSNQEIGEKLFLSLNTVKYHLRNIYSKMGASTKHDVIERIEYIWSQND